MKCYSADFIQTIQEASEIESVFYNCLTEEQRKGIKIYPRKQVFLTENGTGGNVITMVMAYKNKTFEEAIEFLADRAKIKIPLKTDAKIDKVKQNGEQFLYKINNIAQEYFASTLQSNSGMLAMKYLKNRKLEDDMIKNFSLGFAKNGLHQHLLDMGYIDKELVSTGLFNYEEDGTFIKDKFTNRIIFPIWNINGDIIGFGGRTMIDGLKPKYLNSPETSVFNKRKNMYGMNKAIKSPFGDFILCEGYMDVISLHKAGFTNAIASLGTAFTDEQSKLISYYTDSVYLSYDNDEAGQSATKKAVEMLDRYGIVSKRIDMSPYKDPDEFINNLGKDEYKKRISEAKIL